MVPLDDAAVVATVVVDGDPATCPASESDEALAAVGEVLASTPVDASGGADAVREGGVDVYKCEAIHSSTWRSRASVSPLGPLGGSSSLQIGHSSSSAIWRLGGGVACGTSLGPSTSSMER